MKEKQLKLSELYLINEAVDETKINLWKSFSLALALGFSGIHWIQLKKRKTGYLRFFVTFTTFLIFALASQGVIEDKELGQLIIFGLVIISLVWNVLDLFLINKLNNELTTKTEENMTKILEKRRYYET